MNLMTWIDRWNFLGGGGEVRGEDFTMAQSHRGLQERIGRQQ